MVEPDFIAPFSLPTAIPRFYYCFRKAIHLRKEDVDNEARCQSIYKEVKSEIEAAIEFLKEGRERDPYKDAVPRLLYEASWSGRQAPTFKV